MHNMVFYIIQEVDTSFHLKESESFDELKSYIPSAWEISDTKCAKFLKKLNVSTEPLYGPL